MAVAFRKVDKPTELLPVVKQRLPISCFIYNQLQFHEKASDDLEIYALGTGEETWVLTKYVREDWGLMISISAPDSLEISKDVRKCLVSSGIINWQKPFLFNSLQGHVTKLIADINVEDWGNVITIYPCYLFYMDPSDALELQISPPPNTELRHLDTETGTRLISDNWKYNKGSKTDTMVRKSIERFASGGIYVEGNLVTGAVTPAFGLISMLHTDPKHRRKGYASLVMRYIFKALAQEGLYPCLCSEICNETAVNFHHSLGLQKVAQLNYIGCGESH